ncbi:MAG TPA: hypothetical protein VER11_33390 [Polyangiaceae bacterium]|nr:hypothetical protein [Polyangiaceae bacterium]
MSQTAVLVWLSATSILPTFRADLDAFAHSRLLRLEAPRENAAPYYLAAGAISAHSNASAYAPDAVAQIESSLEEARNAAASLEQGRALAALERAEHVLREHPELPQSAWLMAEIFEQSAELENAAPDGAEAANALRERAAALEGPRAAPFADRAPEHDPENPVVRQIDIEGLEPGDTLEWDGTRTAPTFATATGDHHARVARGGRLMWAGWLKLVEGQHRVRLPVPETVACSTDDIGRGRFSAGRAIAAAHARCDSYVLAQARASGGIEAALCERERCGQVVIWESSHKTDAQVARAKSGWPYVIAASVGAIAVTSIVLWRTGVFDRAEPGTREVWVFNGQKQMGLSF